MKPSEAKTKSFVIFGAFVMMVCVLGVVSGQVRVPPNEMASPPYLFIGMAGASVLACLGWTWMRILPQAEVGEAAVAVSAEKFLSNLTVGLSFAELPAVLGFSMAPMLQELRYGFFGASLACLLLVLFPAMLRYWSVAEPFRFARNRFYR